MRAKRRRIAVRVAGVALALALLPLIGLSAASQAAVSTHGGHGVHKASGSRLRHHHAVRHTEFPVGVYSSDEPSHLAPPGTGALKGYARNFVDDFNSSLSSSDWFLFSGVPKGDPSGLFAPSHVTVKDGMLVVSTYRDPDYGDQWVSGGAGLYSVHPTYGAFFVRSRITGVGPDDVELLWPQDNQWPPEIDFNETGISPTESTWTVHYDTPSDQAFFKDWHVNLLRWHTWGVIWTPKTIIFTLDGKQWGPRITRTSEIPDIPMALDIQQQSFCGIAPECPTKSTSLLVDWVAVFTPNG